MKFIFLTNLISFIQIAPQNLRFELLHHTMKKFQLIDVLNLVLENNNKIFIKDKNTLLNVMFQWISNNFDNHNALQILNSKYYYQFLQFMLKNDSFQKLLEYL